MKIRPVEAELFHAKRIAEGRKDRRTNGRTDTTKIIVAFHDETNSGFSQLAKGPQEE